MAKVSKTSKRSTDILVFVLIVINELNSHLLYKAMAVLFRFFVAPNENT